MEPPARLNNMTQTLMTLKNIMDICQPLCSLSDPNDKSPMKEIFMLSSSLFCHLSLNRNRDNTLAPCSHTPGKF